MQVPDIMRGVVYSKYYEKSSSEAMEIRDDLPTPAIKEDEVLVKVHAVSINPVDWKMAKGYVTPGFTVDFPMIPCFDFAGEVAAIGSKCERLKVGDEVYGVTKVRRGKQQGAAAEYTKTLESCCAIKPEGLSFSEAASVPIVGLTAYQALNDLLHEGCKILILGGSGGMGSFAIELAKCFSCDITATGSTRNVEMLQNIGVDRIINYELEQWYKILKGEEYDVVYDCVGEEKSYKKARKVLKEDGHFISVVEDDEHEPSFPSRVSKELEKAGRTIQKLFTGGPSFNFCTYHPTDAWTDLTEITKLIDRGIAHPHIEKFYHMDEITEALDYCQTHKVRGKTIVQIIPEQVFLPHTPETTE
eukprot:TRINITY_DN3070_c0_g2_i1.p1 TRINITY_DN3070_c0_g2~~TRINITY_DN3070_c0_g2_i1.p1  ORF type:complete len:359 (+),score=84.60 TRINITY_DN3070_c0_g2_i1:143-1219(+)